MMSGRLRIDMSGFSLTLLSASLLTVSASLFAGCGDADGDRYSVNQGDCDDGDPDINPFAVEICDGIDQDCDGKIDEGLYHQYYPDADGDGYGIDADPVELCVATEGYSANTLDCDDGAPAINPAATEVCNGQDEDCDGTVDEGVKSTFYPDTDGDGYGGAVDSVTACETPSGFVTNYDDCDDGDVLVHPFVEDVSNGLDDDCDGETDDLFTAVTGGESHSLALRSDGTVWAWGSNEYGQLGVGSSQDQLIPVQVAGLDRIVAIAAGYDHSLALRLEEDNRSTEIWAWGNNDEGQLGDGSSAQRTSPVRLTALSNASAIAAGGYHSLALLPGGIGSDGEVWAWGRNDEGQLGDGTTDTSYDPIQVASIVDIVSIAAGDLDSFSIDADGDVYGWGYNDMGQIGDGTVTTRTTPVDLFSLSDTIEVAGGLFLSLSLQADGTVYTWGVTTRNQSTGEAQVSLTPKKMSDLADIVQVAAGSKHAVVLDAAGVVWIWGNNDEGQLGDGSTTSAWSVAEVGGLPDIRVIGCGSSHTLAIGTDGTIWTWGANESGQLGNWSTEDSTVPVEVKWTVEVF